MKIEILKNSEKSEIYGEYDQKWISIVKGINGAKYDPSPKRWIIDTSKTDELISKLQENNIEFDFIKEKFSENSENMKPNFVTVSCNEESFTVKLPVPKKLFSKTFYIPKHKEDNQWKIQNEFYPFFYKSCQDLGIYLYNN